MVAGHASHNRLSGREWLTATLILTGLALPFLRLPGDGMARMKVNFRNQTTSIPAKFTTQTPLSVCAMLAYSLDYEDPGSGQYTHIDCEQADFQP